MDGVGDTADDAKVMADENHRHAEALFEVCEKIENFCGNRHVECGRRFIGDQKIRVASNRHRNRDALALPPRQFLRIGPQPAVRLIDTNTLQELLGPDLRRAAWQTSLKT